MSEFHEMEVEWVRMAILEAKSSGMSKDEIREALDRVLARGAVYDRHKLDGAVEKALAEL